MSKSSKSKSPIASPFLLTELESVTSRESLSLNCPCFMEAGDYHEFKEIVYTLSNHLKKPILKKGEKQPKKDPIPGLDYVELGCFGDYLGLLYSPKALGRKIDERSPFQDELLFQLLALTIEKEHFNEQGLVHAKNIEGLKKQFIEAGWQDLDVFVEGLYSLETVLDMAKSIHDHRRLDQALVQPDPSKPKAPRL